jgi:hypothetical protein
MPVVSISLSEIGYNGYTNIPKGLRSKLVDKLLREYDLKSHSVVLPFADRAISVDQVMENQGKMQQTLESQAQIIGILKTERDELEYKLDSWSKEFQEGAKK